MSDLKTKKENDLIKSLQEKRKALYGFRFGVSGSNVKNVKEAKNIKKEIAQILTELHSRKGK